MIHLRFNKNRILIEADNDILDELKYHFTAPNPAAKFSPYAQPMVSPITPLGSFHIGLFKEIYEKLEELFPLEEIDIDQDVLKRAFPLRDCPDVLIQADNEKYIYRDYQESSIRSSLTFGRGVILLPTRSGKSLVMYGILKNMNYKKGLIVVPNIQLVKQMYADFIEYGHPRISLQMFSGFSKDIVTQDGIIITNTQYLLKHPLDIPTSDVIFIDEVHGLKRRSKLSDWMKKQKTNIRFGMTGTMPEGAEDIWNVNGLVGPILHEEKVHKMQKEKVLADVKIYPIKLIHKNKIKFAVESYEDIVAMYRKECEALESIDEANKIIVNIAKNLEGNSMILFDHIEHGRKLFEMLDHEDKCFVDGSVALDSRLETQSKMSQKGNTITVANTKCFATGITISELKNIIFSSGGKTSTKVIQAVGRSLLKNKDFSILIDVFHNYKYSERHFKSRCELYKEFYDIKNLMIKSIDI